MYENKTTKNNKGTTFSGKVYRKVGYVSVRKSLRYVEACVFSKEKQNNFVLKWNDCLSQSEKEKNVGEKIEWI